MPKKTHFTLDEKQEILSLYAQGKSITYIGKKLGYHFVVIKKFLKDLQVYKSSKHEIIFYKNKCSICGKAFWSINSKRLYCYNPCDCRYKKDTKSYEKSINYHYLKVIRSDFWKLVKSNPSKALKYRQNIIDEEGEEFADFVLGEIIKSEEFKHLMLIHDKYKKVFSV